MLPENIRSKAGTKEIYRMYSESKILKFTLDLGFTGIANIVNFNILVLIYIYIYIYLIY